ncbi:MAG: hypothetical protein OXB86_02335 [Bdellovibrionales bacterium]|nr:hypothetical protein [Bdellovibrionales bacterium]
MLKPLLAKWQTLWFLISALIFVVVLMAFTALNWWSNISNRVPAQFSQQDFQYAEVLWGDEEQGEEQPETAYPSVQPQWKDETGTEDPYSYSDPVADDLQKQIREDYHARLYEEWKRRKEEAAVKAEEEKNRSSDEAAVASPENRPEKTLENSN